MIRLLKISYFLVLIFLATSLHAEKKQEVDLTKTDKRTDKFLLGAHRPEGKKDEELPMFIRSNSLEVDSIKRTFSYKGNVEVIRGDIEITAEKVVGSYDENQEIQQIICEEQVVVTRASGDRASANKAIYEVQKETIRLTEAPELFKGGSILIADTVVIYLAENRSEAEGNVRVKVLPKNASAKNTPYESLDVGAENEQRFKDAEAGLGAIAGDDLSAQQNENFEPLESDFLPE